jgi:hypothetical protein
MIEPVKRIQVELIADRVQLLPSLMDGSPLGKAGVGELMWPLDGFRPLPGAWDALRRSPLIQRFRLQRRFEPWPDVRSVGVAVTLKLLVSSYLLEHPQKKGCRNSITFTTSSIRRV